MSEHVTADHHTDLITDAETAERQGTNLREILQWSILGVVALALVGGISFVHWQYVNSSAFDPNSAFTLICH